MPKSKEPIQDEGWAEMRRQFEHKLQLRGGQLLTVNPRNTSVAEMNTLEQSKHKCVDCGLVENSDLLAARNVLAAGQAMPGHRERVPTDPLKK